MKLDLRNIGTVGRILILSVFLLQWSCGNSKEVSEGVNPAGVPPPDSKFKEAFHAAIMEKTIGHYDKAIPLFEECLLLNPNHSATYYALSDLYEMKGETGKAIENAVKAYELDKSNKWYSVRLAELNFGLGNFSKASKYYANFIEDEKNIDVKYQYAEALIYSGQPQKAIDMLDEIEIETGKIPEVTLTKHDLYQELENFEAAEKELESLIEENPSNVDNYLIIADYFLNTNNPAKAEEILERAKLVDAESGELLVMMADVALRKSDIQGAFSNLQLAFASGDILLDRKIELVWGLSQFAFNPSNPDGKEIQKGVGELFDAIYDEEAKNADLHNKYGIYLMKSGEKEKARIQFEFATYLNPDSFYAWRELLNLDFEMGNYVGMKKHAGKAVELFPAQSMFYLLNGIALYKLEEYDPAFEQFYFGKDLVVNDPELVSEFLYHMGKMNCLRGEYEEGYEYFKQAIDEYAQNGKVYNEKTKFLILQGKIGQAESEIAEAKKLLPGHPAVLDADGLLKMKRKDFEGALAAFEAALRGDLTNPNIMEHYGDALYLTGNGDEAIGMWKDAVYYGARSELINRKIKDKMYYEK